MFTPAPISSQPKNPSYPEPPSYFNPYEQAANQMSTPPAAPPTSAMPSQPPPASFVPDIGGPGHKPPTSSGPGWNDPPPLALSSSTSRTRKISETKTVSSYPDPITQPLIGGSAAGNNDNYMQPSDPYSQK